MLCFVNEAMEFHTFVENDFSFENNKVKNVNR